VNTDPRHVHLPVSRGTRFGVRKRWGALFAACAASTVATTASFASSGGNVAPAGYVLFIASGMVGGLVIGWPLLRRSLVGAAFAAAAGAFVAPWLIVIVLFVAYGGGH
jgi:hypothetical protein